MKKISSIIICALLSATACNMQNGEKNKKEMNTIEMKASNPGFVHAVYFWLKKDNPVLLKEFKEVALPKLATVPSIKNVYWGPSAGTPREVVDNTYDMSWIVTFDSAAEQDEYQVDPIHLEFVKKYESLFDQVKVYDSIVENSK